MGILQPQGITVLAQPHDQGRSHGLCGGPSWAITLCCWQCSASSADAPPGSHSRSPGARRKLEQRGNKSPEERSQEDLSCWEACASPSELPGAAGSVVAPGLAGRRRQLLGWELNKRAFR